jgi:hypothetical protein
MTIVVDTREHFIDEIKDLLVSSIIGEEVPPFEFRCLPLGDYSLEYAGCSMLIERKSVSDFCGTYRELKRRLAKMRKLDYERTGLLIEGTYKVANGSVWLWENHELHDRMRYRTMCNFLTHQQELGTRLYHTMCLEETIWRLIHIHNYLPALDEPVPALKCGTPAELLVQLPGIGPKSVLKLQQKYATPLDALNNLPTETKKLLEKW